MPRYGRFIWTGVLAGLALAVVLAVVRGGAGTGTGAGTALLYLGPLFVTLGGAAGALAAVLLDRRTGG